RRPWSLRRAPKQRERLIDLSQVEQRLRQIVLRLVPLGRDREHVPKARDGRDVVFARTLRAPGGVPDLRTPWIDGQRGAIRDERLVESPHLLQGVAQVRLTIDELRLDRERAPVRRDGLLEPPLLMRDDAELVTRVLVLRVGGRNAPITFSGFGEPALAVVRHALLQHSES